MNYLLAKVKGRGNSFLKVIASRQPILEIPNLDNTVDYSPNTLLDNGEWFKIVICQPYIILRILKV
jgi:hypothetical protein